VSGVAACSWEYELTIGEMTKFGNWAFGEVTFGEMTFGEMTTVGEMTFSELTFREMAFGDLKLHLKHLTNSKRVQRLYYTGSVVSLRAWLALTILAGHNN